jgi:hypothetical protein
MEQFKFSSIKEKKDEKLAVFKSAARMGLTEINITLSTQVEDECEEFPTMLEGLKKQAAADFKRSLPSF